MRRQLGLRLPCGVELVPLGGRPRVICRLGPTAQSVLNIDQLKKPQPQRFNRGSDANNNHHVERC
jgi:hypothetical protein